MSRCPCGYLHAHITHVCDKGKAKQARQGVFFVRTTDSSYVSDNFTDSARALNYAKRVSARMRTHPGIEVVKVDEPGGEKNLRVIRKLPAKR